MTNATMWGFAGLALAGVMASVAITGRVNLPGRIVVALSAYTTAKGAIDLLYDQSAAG